MVRRKPYLQLMTEASWIEFAYRRKQRSDELFHVLCTPGKKVLGMKSMEVEVWNPDLWKVPVLCKSFQV